MRENGEDSWGAGEERVRERKRGNLSNVSHCNKTSGLYQLYYTIASSYKEVHCTIH